MLPLMLAWGLATIPQSGAASFFEDRAKGWHWYEAPPLVEPEPKIPSDALPPEGENPKGAASAPSATELVKAYREALEGRLHAAWVNPTPQNLQAYQEMQRDLMNRSKIFATVWMQNVFRNPHLDHTLASPVNQQARHLQSDLEKSRAAKAIQSLSEAYGLFFFFAGDCPYCHQFAPIVKKFAQIHGWEVIPISVDGGGVAEFSHAQADNGLFDAWGIKVLPALYAVNPRTEEAIPIAHGLTSLDDMENRIMTLMAPSGRGSPDSRPGPGAASAAKDPGRGVRGIPGITGEKGREKS